MDKNFNQVFTGVVSTLICGICMGMFKMYTDVEILKNRLETQEKLIMKQQEYSEKFDVMIQKFDKTLAVQAATVQTLRETLDRVESNSKPTRR